MDYQPLFRSLNMYSYPNTFVTGESKQALRIILSCITSCESAQTVKIVNCAINLFEKYLSLAHTGHYALRK